MLASIKHNIVNILAYYYKPPLALHISTKTSRLHTNEPNKSLTENSTVSNTQVKTSLAREKEIQLVKDQFRLDLVDYISNYTDVHAARYHHTQKLEQLECAPSPAFESLPPLSARQIYERECFSKHSQVNNLTESYETLPQDQKAQYETQATDLADRYKRNSTSCYRKHTVKVSQRFIHNQKFEALLNSFVKLAHANGQHGVHANCPPQYNDLAIPGYKLFLAQFITRSLLQSNSKKPMNEIEFEAAQMWTILPCHEKTRFVVKGELTAS